MQPIYFSARGRGLGQRAAIWPVAASRSAAPAVVQCQLSGGQRDMLHVRTRSRRYWAQQSFRSEGRKPPNACVRTRSSIGRNPRAQLLNCALLLLLRLTERRHLCREQPRQLGDCGQNLTKLMLEVMSILIVASAQRRQAAIDSVAYGCRIMLRFRWGGVLRLRRQLLERVAPNARCVLQCIGRRAVV